MKAINNNKNIFFICQVIIKIRRKKTQKVQVE